MQREPIDPQVLEAVKIAIRDASLEDINYPEDTTEMWLGDDVRVLDTEGLDTNEVALLAVYRPIEGAVYKLVLTRG